MDRDAEPGHDRRTLKVMAVCGTRGQENPGIARFCLACGAPLAAQAPTGREVRKTVTVVFSDIAGSTALGERLDPESLRGVMGRYFEAMRAVLERHGGTVEKFIGDAVMAVFGIPVVHEDDALRAVRAAAEMRAALDLNDELERERGVRIQMRAGSTPARSSPATRRAAGVRDRRCGQRRRAARAGGAAGRDPPRREHVPARARRRHGRGRRAARAQGQGRGRCGGSAARRPEADGPPARFADRRARPRARAPRRAFDGRRASSVPARHRPRSAGVGKTRLVQSSSRGADRRPAGPLPVLRRGDHLLADRS